MMDRFILRAQLRAVLPGGVVLHASSVAEDDRALVFLALSGGGKSTVMGKLSKKWFGAIADDSVVVARGTDGVIRCLPCGSMKQGTGIENIHGARLNAFYFLEKGSPGILLPVSPEYACYRAMRYSPIMALHHVDRTEQNQAVNFLRELLFSFPSFVLRYHVSEDPADLILNRSRA